MIDREKVIKGLSACIKTDCECCPYNEAKAINSENPICFINEMLSDVLTLLKEQEWNMLTEDDDGIIHGLPGDDGQYLMTDGKNIWIDDYADGVDDGIFLDSGKDIREIKAWMYMPKLPQEGR